MKSDICVDNFITGTDTVDDATDIDFEAKNFQLSVNESKMIVNGFNSR